MSRSRVRGLIFVLLVLTLFVSLSLSLSLSLTDYFCISLWSESDDVHECSGPKRMTRERRPERCEEAAAGGKGIVTAVLEPSKHMYYMV